ncbi:MAG TPA: type II toxin-antitoxin system VapC family toxin [Gemmataceae bacterium]|nr:type II toxin-antitoxin system VapC family toxin [Gemmataceae bacterium]
MAKRYVPETGSALVDEILDQVPGNRIYVLNVGAGEVLSILVRKKNAGVITQVYFGQALLNFDAEIVRSAEIYKLPIGNRLVSASLHLIVTHSINSTDAITLESAGAIADKLRAGGDDLVLVSSDRCLLRAAQAEGLITFDPENQNHAALAALLAP